MAGINLRMGQAMEYRVVNIVVSGSLGQRIDLNELAELGLIEYDPNYYHGGYLPIRNGVKATIYHSGKYIIPGIKKLDDIKTLFEIMKQKLSPHLDVSKMTPPRIQNLVVSGKLDCDNIGLEDLAMSLPNVEYNPEQFPGIILKLSKNGTVLLFSTGRFVIAGARSIDDVDKTIEKLKRTLKTSNE